MTERKVPLPKMRSIKIPKYFNLIANLSNFESFTYFLFIFFFGDKTIRRA